MLAVAAAVVLVIGVTGSAPLPGIPKYAHGYTAWTKLNRAPIPKRANDPHFAIKNVYASKLPPRASARYPVGTVIVKEGRAKAGAPVTLIAVMRKVSSVGANNGWVMIEWSRSSARSRFTEVARGRVCYSCHVAAKKADYVFTKRR